MRLRLEGLTALVTGAGRGLGSEIALRLAEEGALVALHHHASEQGARALLDRITSAGGRALLVRADLRDPAACRRAVEQAENEMGRLDVLVHNAGVALGGPLLGADFEGIRHTIDVNLLAALFCTAAAVPGMLRRRFGRVIAIASAVARGGGSQGQCAYASSKAGLVGFVRTLANELSPRADFTANAVSPGVIPTDLTALALEAMGRQLLDAIPLRAYGTPADVAGAVAYLASPDGRYVNGQDLGVDGGYSLKYLARRRERERSST